MLRDYLPGLGSHSARKRWRQLREDALALDVLAALAWGKWIEQNVYILSLNSTGDNWFIWLAMATFLSAVHVHESRIKRAAEAASEAVEDAVDESEGES